MDHDDVLPNLDQGFANWIARSAVNQADAAAVAATVPASFVSATLPGLHVAAAAAFAGGDAVRPAWNTAAALSLTIGHQQDEIDTLRGMLGIRERQVDDLRQEIDLLTRQMDVLKAALDDAMAREGRTACAAPDPDWTQPMSLLPRGMR
jgi:hypothetical protein